MHKKKLLTAKKRPKWCFWRLIAFFSAFSKIPTKRTIVRLFFLKLNQAKTQRTNFWGGFYFKNKNSLFWGTKIVVFKTQISKKCSAFVLLYKRKHHADFDRKILIFRPPGIFWKKKKLCCACAGVWPKILIWTSKIIPDLLLSQVPSSVRSKK